jgi:type I restriction-modification system DNA methylase subunit
MTNDRKTARQQIEKLVAFFSENIYQFKASSFNEIQARQQLIDPFFESLGWDVRNIAMKPLYLQEVIPEGRVKTTIGMEVKEQQKLFETKETLAEKNKEYSSILDYIAEDAFKANSKEAIKKPDYRFRIKGQTKFFVEAKKPFVDLSRSQEAIFQVKRYGFSGRVPVSILTDFEEFRVFDCTNRPQFEKPKLGVLKDYDFIYKKYLDHFDKLFDTFSRDAVEAGSLETLTKRLLQKKTGDFALDKEFLEDLSKWREELAREIAGHPRNRKRLTDYTLNESVQRILDRIVFLRVCEDREIEVENTLLAILRLWQNRPGISLYSLLNDLFKQRRALYNGLLFAPHECEDLEVGNDVLVKILQNLNYPFSPYHFNEIGVEILGSIYEKFLGKTIHLTAKTTRIEEKPEVRKAGGVYYTPQYIVKYIVDNTLGKLLYKEEPSLRGIPDNEVGRETKQSAHSEKSEIATSRPSGTRNDNKKILGLSPKQVSKLKIIDIACGSGSFLLGAFQKLIDYHIEWYTEHPKDIQVVNNVPDAYKDANGNLHLSPRKKRDILVNNIYGVDIDRQAVEVTQMSLYLKVLEGENAETLNPQMTLALKEVYLPSLSNNIKCGNSLIGTDFTSQGEMFDDALRQKVNPFDWESEFPEILKGNPSLPSPIGEGKGGVNGFDIVIGNPPYLKIEHIEENDRKYFSINYSSYYKRYDTYGLFIEKALWLLRKGGLFGEIVPSTMLNNLSFSALRKILINNSWIYKISNLGGNVFDGVNNDTLILLFSKGKSNGNRTEIYDVQKYGDKIDSAIHTATVDLVKTSIAPEYPIEIRVSDEINYLLSKMNLCGTSLDKICSCFQGFVTGSNEAYIIDDKKIRSEKLERIICKPAVFGDEVSRYGISTWKNYVIYLTRESNLDQYPKIKARIWPFKGELSKKREVRLGRQPWYSLHWPRIQSNYERSEKILVQAIRNLSLKKRIVATIDADRLFADHTLNVVYTNQEDYSLKYILGILNSSLVNFCFSKKYLDINIKGIYLLRLPIRTIDFSNPADKKMHDDLVELVDKMLKLNKELQAKTFDSEREPLERQIAATDKKIDALVYKLYGLTEEEIAIVEGKL